MKLSDFLKRTKLEKTLLVGYYGGGNYGDELLLEVMQHLLAQQGVKNLTVTYQYPDNFKTMHHDLGYKVIDIRSKFAIPLHTLKNKNIIIGGGALWGVDMNLNTLLLSIALLLSRVFLGKNIYLIGIGYHNSTTKMGRFGAWCAGKAARLVLARDPETYSNFQKITKDTYLDKDIAMYINAHMLKEYRDEAKEIAERLELKKEVLFVTLRRAANGRLADGFRNYNTYIEEIVHSHPNLSIVIAPLELEAVGKKEYEIARRLEKKYPHVKMLSMPYNPLALVLFFKQYNKNLVLIGPQFHIIMTAQLTGVPYFPVVYDNKVSELLKLFNTEKQIPLNELKQNDMRMFINQELARE